MTDQPRTTWKTALRPVIFVATSLWLGFCIGVAVQKHYRGEARVIRNVDLHDSLNHGQPSVEIELPDDVRFANFGGCAVHWKRLRDGKTMWNAATIEIETYDADTRSFWLAPDKDNHWVEIEP